MIIDRIENAALYYPLHPKFKQAFDYIAQINIHTLPAGRHEIDNSMYVLVQEYTTKTKEEGKWEAHRRYIDLQYVVQGAEGMGYTNIHHLRQGEYIPLQTPPKSPLEAEASGQRVQADRNPCATVG